MQKVDILNTPVYSSTPEENVLFCDFGKHAFAVLEIEAECDSNAQVTLAVGEVENCGRINREPGGSRIYQEQTVPLSPGKNSVKMEMSHAGYNNGTLTLTPNAVPFRYAEVRGKVKKLKVFQHAYFGHFDDDGSDFKSSSPALDRLWEFCKYTMKATTPFGIFVDGNRERQAYEGDTYINQLGYFVCTSDSEIARNTVDRLFAYPTWPTEWRLSMIPIIHDYALYTGDLTSVEKWYDRLKENLLLDGMNEDHLLNAHDLENIPGSIGINNVPIKVRDIVDWPAPERDGYEMAEVNLVPNCWFYMALCRMAEIAKLLKKMSDCDELLRQAELTRKSIRRQMFKNGLFTDSPDSVHTALHSCIFPVLWNIAESDEKEQSLKLMRSKGMACSVFVSQFLLECCYLNGLSDYALELMLSNGKRSWNNMINCGATIAMEAWDDSFKPNQDWNHPWGAAPGNIIVRHLAGIRPLEPGFKKFSVEPQPASLAYFKVKTPTPRGGITLEMSSPGKYTLTVPPESCAVFKGREYSCGCHCLQE